MSLAKFFEKQGKKVCKTTGFRRLPIQSSLNQLKNRNEGFSRSSLQQFQQNCIYAFHTIVFPSWVPPTFKIISSPRFAVNKWNFVEGTQKDVFYARFRGNGCITFLTLVERYPPRGFQAQKAGYLVKQVK